MLLDSQTRASLSSTAGRLGFKSVGNLEKFVADFDAHAAISDGLACHVRGGLCFPFHVPDAAHRLSVDLDLYTPASVDAVAGAVPGFLTGYGFVRASLHQLSRDVASIRHLVRFDAVFKSKFNKNVTIHVDVSCGIDPGIIRTTEIPAGYKLLGITTTRDISALSRGSLMADKITSLGIGTVGYQSLESTPKQIYDIGKLIQNSTIDDLLSMMSTYRQLTEFKLSKTRQSYTQKEVMESIMSYLGNLESAAATLDLDRHWDYFTQFSATMLSEPQQAKADHMERILLVSACAKFLARSLEPGASCAIEAASLHAIVDGANARRGSRAHLAFLRERLGELAS